MNDNIFNKGLLSLVNPNSSTEPARVFLASEKINVFPCSRRGQITLDGSKLNCDPEARLNTERTNRLRASTNGFTDSFIANFDEITDDRGIGTGTGALVFYLAGYRIEINNCSLNDIAEACEPLGELSEGTLYAHLSLHDEVSLGVPGYFTEILYRQIANPEHNYLDVEYSNEAGKVKKNFFMGLSFTTAEVTDIIQTKTRDTADHELYSANLPLFSFTREVTAEKVSYTFNLIKTSLLPKIGHGETDDSIVVLGDAEFKKNLTVTEHLDSSSAEIDTLTVPYTVEGAAGGAKTTIEHDGISTPYIYAESLAADGIAVGGALRIVDDIENPQKQTTIGHTTNQDGITTTNITATGTITANTALNVTKAEGTSDPAVATIDKADIDNAEINESLAVGTDKFSVTADAANFTVPVNVNNNVTINGENYYIKTPTLDVKTIKNDGTEAVTVDDDLTVKGNLVLDADKAVTADTVNVNTINSRQEHGTITVASPVKVTNVLEVTGETTLQSNLKVADNINVGNLTADEMKKANNGGYIVAKQDIIAKHNLIAENDATITNKLTSGSLSTGEASASSLTVTGQSDLEGVVANAIASNGIALTDGQGIIGQVPALTLATQTNGSVRLCFNFGSVEVTE